MSGYDLETNVKNSVKRYNSLVGTLNEEDTIECSLCKNKGFIAEIRRYGDSIERVLVECECQTQRRTIRKLKKLGYDLDFNNKTFETFKTPEKWQKEYKELALDYVKNGDKNWLLIEGTTGSGKTHLATAVSRELILQNKTYHYMSFSSDIVRIKNGLNNFDEKARKNAEKEIDLLSSVDVLYIDDFLKVSEYTLNTILDVVFIIINNRYVSKKQTIITTEKTLRDMYDYDGAIAGRIFEMVGKYRLSSNDTSRNVRLWDEKKWEG